MRRCPISVDEGHRAEARCGVGAWTVRAQSLLHHSQEQAQGGALKFRNSVRMTPMPQINRNANTPLLQMPFHSIRQCAQKRTICCLANCLSVSM
jgi:hypothetical protein